MRQSKRSKNTPKAESSSSNDGQEYEVSEIIEMKEKSGKREFLVRWKGFSDKDNTWEKEENLNCEALIDDFLNNKETDDDDDAPLNESKGGKAKKASKRSRTNSEGNDEKDDTDEKNADSDDDPLPTKSKAKKGKKSAKANKTSKRSKGSDSEEEEDDGKEYEVSKVIEVHHKKNGEREFLVRWKGFSAKDDTWEPESNLNCSELIEGFLKKVEKAKAVTLKETRVGRKKTDRFVINSPDSGRKLSGRRSGARVTYNEQD